MATSDSEETVASESCAIISAEPEPEPERNKHMDEETGTHGSGASTKCSNLMSGDRSAPLLRGLKTGQFHP